MRRATLAMLAVLALACGGSETTPQVADAQDAATEAAAKAGVEKVAGDRREMPSEDVCEIMKSGILNEVLDANEESWNYRPASKVVPQALCTATGTSQDGSSDYEVALMIMRSKFDSPADAVASLEGTVKQLTEGLTITVGGKTRTRKVEFEPFMEGVGDQAAWAPKMSELSVAHKGTRFAVTVRGAGDSEANKAKAIELARLIGDAL